MGALESLLSSERFRRGGILQIFMESIFPVRSLCESARAAPSDTKAPDPVSLRWPRIVKKLFLRASSLGSRAGEGAAQRVKLP